MRAQQKGCPGVGPRHGHWPQARLQGCCSSRAVTAALPVPLCMCKPLFSGLSLPQEESSLTCAMRAFEARSCTAQGTQQAAVEGGDPLSDTLLALRLPGSGLTVLTSCEHQRMASHLVPTETREGALLPLHSGETGAPSSLTQRQPRAGLEQRQLLTSRRMPRHPHPAHHRARLFAQGGRASQGPGWYCNYDHIRNRQCHCNHPNSTHFFTNPLLN